MSYYDPNYRLRKEYEEKQRRRNQALDILTWLAVGLVLVGVLLIAAYYPLP